MGEEQIEQPQPKKRGRPKGSKNKKKDEPVEVAATTEAVVTEQLNSIVNTLGALSKRLDSVQNLVTSGPLRGRAPGSPMANELGPQLPGPGIVEENPAERDKKRRDAIYENRRAKGRNDTVKHPKSGSISSVGNRQRRNSGNIQIVRPQ